MQEGDSSVRWIASKKVDKIAEGVWWALPREDVPITHDALLCEYVYGSIFFWKSRQIPLNHLSPTCRLRFYQLKVETLIAVKCSDIGVTLKKPVLAHRDARRWVSAAQPMGEGTIVGYDYGFLVYENLNSSGSRFKTYGESVVEVTRETFRKWENRLLKTARTTVRHPV